MDNRVRVSGKNWAISGGHSFWTQRQACDRET